MRFSLVLVAPILAAVAGDLAARGIEPGQWRITTTLHSPLLPGPQAATSRQCITREDVKDPSRAIDKRLRSDCRTVSLRQHGNLYTWEVHCAQSGLSSKGSMQHRPGTVAGESRMTADVFGQKLDMVTEFSGQRLGPCP